MKTTTYLTVADAAKRLGVSDSRIRQFHLEGKLPRRQWFGRMLMIHPADIEALRSRDTKPGRKKTSGKNGN